MSAGALIVLAEGEMCRLCGRKGTHECILAPAPSSREIASTQETLAEVSSLRREMRDLSDLVTNMERSWANHHITDAQTTYTCRCGAAFWSLTSFNKHVEDSP